MIQKLFKEKEIKVTKARIAIYELLSNEKTSLKADDIYNKCKIINKNMNLSTVYRTLEIFEEKDLIDKFDLGCGKNSYAIKKNFHKHMLECNLCHKEIEVMCPMQSIEELVKLQTGFELTEHSLTLKGVCEDCKE